MNKKPIVVNCPTCQELVEFTESSQYRPFCSERCKQVDLGAWSTEEYSIPCQQQDEWELAEAQNNAENHSLQ